MPALRKTIEGIATASGSGAASSRASRSLLPPWNPEIETWEDFESRLRSGLDSALPAYRRRTRESFLRRGYRPVPVKTAAHHFRWLAQRQLRGWRPSTIARRHGVHRATVHAALADLSKLLDLPLRPVKPGPEEL